MKHVIYLARRWKWVGLLAVGEAVRWTLLRLCDVGVGVRRRCDAAELDMRVAHVELLAARAGLKGLVKPSAQERQQAAVEACADDLGPVMKNVIPIRSAETKGGTSCRKPL